MAKEVDPGRLKPLLTSAVFHAVTELRRTRPEEHFYAFALFTSGEVHSFNLSANSEEGLSRASESASSEDGTPVGLHRRSMRWMPANWAYHCIGKTFKKANAVLPRPWPIGGGVVALDQAVAESDRILKAGAEVLKALDAEGIFGIGEDRDRVTISILMGDQSTKERLHFAALLNPRRIVVRFRKELEEGEQAFFKWSSLRRKKKK